VMESLALGVMGEVMSSGKKPVNLNAATSSETF